MNYNYIVKRTHLSLYVVYCRGYATFLRSGAQGCTNCSYGDSGQSVLLRNRTHRQEELHPTVEKHDPGCELILMS